MGITTVGAVAITDVTHKGLFRGRPLAPQRQARVRPRNTQPVLVELSNFVAETDSFPVSFAKIDRSAERMQVKAWE